MQGIGSRKWLLGSGCSHIPVRSDLKSSFWPCHRRRLVTRSSGRKNQPHLTCSKPFRSKRIPCTWATNGSDSVDLRMAQSPAYSVPAAQRNA
jgi:hypothetical protein